MKLQPNNEAVKRPYHSPRRAAQADATKRAIIEAALSLFTEQGFRSTTIKQVAQRASVSPQTVYNSFGDKVGLLQGCAVFAMSPTGQDEVDVFMEALADETDPQRRIHLVAQFSRQQWQDGALDIDLLLSSSDPKDPRLAGLADQVLDYKLELNRSICEILFPDPIRRPDVTIDDIAALATVVDSAPAITTLRKLGWTMDRYETWVVQLLELFLRPDQVESTGMDR